MAAEVTRIASVALSSVALRDFLRKGFSGKELSQIAELAATRTTAAKTYPARQHRKAT